MDFQLSFLVHPNMHYPSTSDSGIGMANWNIFCKHNYLEILVNKLIWSLNLSMSGVIRACLVMGKVSFVDIFFCCCISFLKSIKYGAYNLLSYFNILLQVFKGITSQIMVFPPQFLNSFRQNHDISMSHNFRGLKALLRIFIKLHVKILVHSFPYKLSNAMLISLIKCHFVPPR